MIGNFLMELKEEKCRGPILRFMAADDIIGLRVLLQNMEVN